MQIQLQPVQQKSHQVLELPQLLHRLWQWVFIHSHFLLGSPPTLDPHCSLGLSPLVAPQACTLPQPEVVSPAVVTSALALAPATCATTVLQPASSLMARSAQLPTSIFSPVSTSNQSGGQVIVNGTGLNLNINGASTHKGKDTPKPFVLKLKPTNVHQSCCKDYDGSNDTLGLVVSRAERRLVSNLATVLGKQFIPSCPQGLPI